ncbi:MAG: alkaline phosphatase D family protein [Gemmatimonadetes bacterium]|nr:alkaline phosphatase D family protein [Gemmatimonadota bacterium]
MPDRRHFLQQLSALGLGAVAGARVLPGLRANGDPFTLGVASGDPWPDGFVLWTRLAPDPLNGGGMGAEDVVVRWEVATDDGMRHIVRRGTAVAAADFAHAVHVTLRGLAPDRWYWYRFHAGAATSPVGRTRTMPARGASPARLRLVVASCQHYEAGFYAAHAHLAREDADLCAFLGDYIYESHATRRVRAHEAGEPTTLTEYRNRYARYKSDPQLQEAHAAMPWVVTWDDHEVDNNVAGLVSERGDPVEAFQLRRAAAYRAYYEHMPLRRSSVPHGPDMLLYRSLEFGQLARLHVLDGRQYRSDQSCGDRQKAPCAEWDQEGRTMLGAAQERWLARGLVQPGAMWQLLAQQVMMMPLDLDPGPGEVFNMDSWSGYPAARRRLTNLLAERRVANAVVLTGDVHANYAGEVPLDWRQPDAARVAVEYVGTSISSEGDGMDAYPQVERVRSSTPWLKFHNARRGYIRCDITPDAWRSDYRIVPSIQTAYAPIATVASFVTPSGRSVIEPA